MKTNNLIKSIIGVLVITIIVVSVAVPIIGNVSFTEERVINESTAYFSRFGPDAEITIQKASADDPLIINGVEYADVDTTHILVSDRLYVCPFNQGLNIQCYGQDIPQGTTQYYTIVISEGMATVTGYMDFTTPVTEGYCLDPNGEYVCDRDFDVAPGTIVDGYLISTKAWAKLSLGPSTSGFSISDVDGLFKPDGNLSDNDEALTAENIVIDWGSTTITENGDMLHVKESALTEVRVPGVIGVNGLLPLFAPGIMVEGDENYSSLESVIHVVPLIMVVGVVVATVGVFLVRYRT